MVFFLLCHCLLSVWYPNTSKLMWNVLNFVEHDVALFCILWSWVWRELNYGVKSRVTVLYELKFDSNWWWCLQTKSLCWSSYSNNFNKESMIVVLSVLTFNSTLLNYHLLKQQNSEVVDQLFSRFRCNDYCWRLEYPTFLSRGASKLALWW